MAKIRVVCPNGHVIQVKQSLAGRAGLCPVCKARVDVPKIRREALSEDAIMDILGTGEGDASADSAGGPAAEPDPSAAPSSEVQVGPPKKTCNNCNREIFATSRICPHCHTYIADLGDV